MTKKDMELKYEITAGLTHSPCPYGQRHGKFLNHIEAVSCHLCEFYRGEKKNKQIIYCQKQGELKEREAK